MAVRGMMQGSGKDAANLEVVGCPKRELQLFALQGDSDNNLWLAEPSPRSLPRVQLPKEHSKGVDISRSRQRAVKHQLGGHMCDSAIRLGVVGVFIQYPAQPKVRDLHTKPQLQWMGQASAEPCNFKKCLSSSLK